MSALEPQREPLEEAWQRLARAGRIPTMVIFSLSVFGLVTFLWIAFGGPVPLKPKPYEVRVNFPEATTLAQQADVRIAGVSVGKVQQMELGPSTSTRCARSATTRSV